MITNKVRRNGVKYSIIRNVSEITTQRRIYVMYIIQITPYFCMKQHNHYPFKIPVLFILEHQTGAEQ